MEMAAPERNIRTGRASERDAMQAIRCVRYMHRCRQHAPLQLPEPHNRDLLARRAC